MQDVKMPKLHDDCKATVKFGKAIFVFENLKQWMS